MTNYEQTILWHSHTRCDTTVTKRLVRHSQTCLTNSEYYCVIIIIHDHNSYNKISGNHNSQTSIARPAHTASYAPMWKCSKSYFDFVISGSKYCPSSQTNVWLSLTYSHTHIKHLEIWYDGTNVECASVTWPTVIIFKRGGKEIGGKGCIFNSWRAFWYFMYFKANKLFPYGIHSFIRWQSTSCIWIDGHNCCWTMPIYTRTQQHVQIQTEIVFGILKQWEENLGTPILDI